MKISKQTMTLTGKLTISEQLKNSYNGNPRYMLVINNQVFYTRPDSMLAYGITNHRDKNVNVTLSMYRNKLSLDSIENA